MKKEALRNFWYNLSSNQRFLIRRLYYFPTDFFDSLSGRRHKYVPPRGSIYTGFPKNSKEFIRQSEHQLQLLKKYIDLQKEDAVLDIGSGIGRTAIGLATFINSKARYEGFDVVKLGIDWCNSKIHKDFPNFNFTYVPLFNDLYNNSKLDAKSFVFPYKNKTFDKIFSFSVFTHMQIGEIQNYFKEINRVLKPNGLAFSTFFLYDDASENYISRENSFKFPIKKQGYRLMNDKVKSGNIAIHKSKILQMLDKEDLELLSIIDGFWKDASLMTATAEYQDIIVFKKKT